MNDDRLHHDFLPTWSVRQFVVWHQDKRWAASIERELMELRESDSATGHVHFYGSTTAQKTQELVSTANTAGLIMSLNGQTKECLGLLLRFRCSPPIPVLVDCPPDCVELLPVIAEAGAQVVIDPKNDIPIAAWCHRILRRTESA